MIGKNILHYTVLRKLGAGGMGEVYVAEDNHLRRPVALKILPAEYSSDPQRKRRFLQEAHAASILSHPNICVIHEAGEAAEGLLYISMEHIEGRTLASRIEGRPLPVPEIVDLGAQIADAIDEAHSKGIVHRDLKPANVMITARGHAKVLDFGLAKVRTEESTISDEESTGVRSVAGALLGTLPYMSPEQALGRPVDHRTDIFSLGVILYEMATGKLPFDGQTAAERITNIARSDPTPPSQLNRAIPAALDRVIRKCLEKDPGRRYQNGREIESDLRKVTGGAPRLGRTATIMAASIAGIAILVALFFVIRPRLVARSAIDSVAVLPFANSSRNPDLQYMSDGIADTLINSISQLPKLRVMARSTTFRYRGQFADPKKVGDDLGVAAVLTGEVRPHGNALDVTAELVRTSDGSLIWGQQYNSSMSDAVSLQNRIIADVARAIRGRSSDAQQRMAKRGTDDNEAYQLYLKGRFAWNRQTPESLKAAQNLFQQAIARDPHYALAYVGLADAYLMVITFSDSAAAESLPKARAAALRALEIDDSLAEAYASLAMTQFNYWQWAEAEKNFRRSIELNPNYPTAHDWYSNYLVTMRRLDEALAQIKRAHELDPLSSIIAADVGAVKVMNGDLAGGIRDLEQVSKVEPGLPLGHQWLAFAYLRAGRLDDCVAESQKEMETSGETLLAKANLAFAYSKQGNKVEARKAAELVFSAKDAPATEPMVVAGAYMALGDHTRAIQALARGVDRRMGTMTFITWPPWFDDIQQDPRYQALLRQMQLR